MNTEEHYITIGIVAKSQGTQEVRLRQLYAEAVKAVENQTQVVSNKDMSVSLLAPVTVPNAKVAVVTDLKTGWFVQLVAQPNTPVLLTIGRKFCISGYDVVNQTTATQMHT